jgi:hypothetical protein
LGFTKAAKTSSGTFRVFAAFISLGTSTVPSRVPTAGSYVSGETLSVTGGIPTP